MKRIIIPALAFFVFSAAAQAQQKVPAKRVTTTTSKTVVHQPAGSTANVSPAKTTSPVLVTKATTTTKSAGIKRKHPKTKKGKVNSKKM